MPAVNRDEMRAIVDAYEAYDDRMAEEDARLAAASAWAASWNLRDDPWEPLADRHADGPPDDDPNDEESRILLRELNAAYGVELLSNDERALIQRNSAEIDELLRSEEDEPWA